jgi:hypothetical protein
VVAAAAHGAVTITAIPVVLVAEGVVDSICLVEALSLRSHCRLVQLHMEIRAETQLMGGISTVLVAVAQVQLD